MMHPFRSRLRALDPLKRTGRVQRVSPTRIEASGPNVPVGTICSISLNDGSAIQAEVLSVDRETISLSPFDRMRGIRSGDHVWAATQSGRVAAGPELLGRALDALGRPIDGRGAVSSTLTWDDQASAPMPMERTNSSEVLKTGISVIDGLLTMSIGQRIGIFATSGAGKTTLLSQIARQAEVDVIVLCLIGERGQEVADFWNNHFNEEARRRMVLVAATSDQPATMRVRACEYALAQADYWRAQGKHVLFFLDSATRLAMAMRELGLAAGEPATVRAYTPNVFSMMPRFVERCGSIARGGAITAIWSVLTEDDEMDDPISEMMKSLLDGHILLSRRAAEQGRFPAVDPVRSLSRRSEDILEPDELKITRKIRQWLSDYDAAGMMIDAGLYTAGTNAELDEAIARRPEILKFLAQDQGEERELKATREGLKRLVGAYV